ncbi:MAG: OmpA family protein [Deltaproteobacteria bacterium]|nr:OmpA family protein [Deltaproteobacteria bacterium]
MLLVFCVTLFSHEASFAQGETSPLQCLKERERENRDQKGEVYLGKVLTLIYPAHGTEPNRSDHPLLLELTDVLKTPLRENYRLVLKGYSDSSGSSDDNLRLSRRRADILKKILVRKYYFSESRIAAEGFGAADPAAVNDTPEGRKLNRRVEIHVYGDVSESVRHLDR